MKESKDLIKVDLIRRKIKEYFSKFPKSNSLIIKSNQSGNNKTLWKVQREGKNHFKITEVSTVKNEFIIKEASMADPSGQPSLGQPQQQQPQVANNSFQNKQASIQQFSQLDLQTKLDQLSSGMMLNYDTAVATMAQIVQDKTRDLVQLRRAIEAGVNAANLDPNQKRLVTSLMGILTSLSNEKALTSSKKNKGLQLKEADEDKGKEREKKEKTGVNSNNQEEPKDNNVPKSKSEEQILFSKSLTGQTIKAVDLELTPDGGNITLQLVSVSAPAELKWFNNGKVVYSFKNRPYIIRSVK